MSDLKIDLIEDVSSPVSKSEFRAMLSPVYDRYERGPAVAEILLTTDQRMQDLNRQHRGTDSTTDVLSLPTTIDSEQGRVVPASDQPSHLGTIVISLEQARRQVGHFGKDLKAELLGLANHGLCHLLGHVHDESGQWLERSSQ